jgi:hypothetical protein
MSTDPALNLLNPDQLLAKLIEMEGVIESLFDYLASINS